MEAGTAAAPPTAEQRRAPDAAPVGEALSPFWMRHGALVRLLAAAGLAWGALYLVWRAGWSGRGAYGPTYWPLLLAEIFGWISMGVYAWLAWRIPSSTRPTRRGAPRVDVFVTTYDEPVAVLEATLAGCAALRYPHTTWLLDDGRRPEVAELAERMGAGYLTRPDNHHAKAGNINSALAKTDGELILTLDADHVPHPDLLDAVLGYFDDPDVGLVQTPHDFYNRDSFQHQGPDRHGQSLFYEVVAPGKDRHGAMFWAGSAAVLRRAALESVGGVLTDTVAEDFHTTIAMHGAGWKSHYHRETLVQGLAPHDLASFLLQRHRWASGNLRVLRTSENPAVTRGLTPAQRASYLGSLVDYGGGVQRLVMLAVLLVTVTTGLLPLHASPATLLGLWLPWTLLGFTSTIALSRGTLAPLDSTVYGMTTMATYAQAALSLLLPRSTGFHVTPKDGVDPGGVREVMRHLRLLTAIGAALVVAVVLRGLAWAGWVPLPELGGLALAVTVAAAAWELVMIGRTLSSPARRHQLRRQYRFPVKLRARIAGSRTVVPLLDLSPAGVGFESPVRWEVGDPVRLLTRVPDPSGRLVDLELPLEVRGAHLDEERGVWRIGARLLADPATRRRVVDYCYVVQPDRQFGRPGPDEAEAEAREALAWPRLPPVAGETA